MTKLFSPIEIKSVTLKNRIVMSPMCQYSAKEGFSNDWHLVHYGTRAAGGTGLIIMEATAVSPEGRITPGDLGLWSDDHIPGLTRIVDFISNYGAVPGIQLAHAGRKASCARPAEGGKQLTEINGGWQTVAPSGIPFQDGERVPVPMSHDDINKVVSNFKSAALRAMKAGFKVIEIHSAHGYLLNEFLSPLSNKRSDDYGGSFENRIRLLTNIIKSVKSVLPEGNPVFVRISSTEWTEGGWMPADSVRLASALKELGVDVVDCSSGGNIHNAVIPAGPGYQVPFSEEIRKTGIMTGAVGFITTPGQAEAILQEEKADLVLLGRELLRNPYFALNSAKSLGDNVKWPDQYLRAK